MKKIFLLLGFSFLMAKIIAQQSVSLDFISPSNEDKLALYGVGSLNSEALTNINAAGKFSGAFRLDGPSLKRKWTFFLSANRNASNVDSTLATTLLFPEVGKASFIGTLNSMWQLWPNKKDQYTYLGAFVQGAFKSINGKRKIKATGRDTTAVFGVIDWEAGIRYLRDVSPLSKFSVSVFVNNYNIPDEDNEDYRLIFDDTRMPSEFWALGVKFVAQVNKVQIFADFRHVYGTIEKIPNRDLRGFSLNLGFIFNADIYTQK